MTKLYKLYKKRGVITIALVPNDFNVNLGKAIADIILVFSFIDGIVEKAFKSIKKELFKIILKTIRNLASMKHTISKALTCVEFSREEFGIIGNPREKYLQIKRNH